jgi:adenine phosphoribosyltransferase
LQDTIEIQKGSIKPGQKVLVVDDLLATGGTLEASCKLIEKIGGVVESCVVVIELTALNGRNKVKNEIHSFVQYDDVE